MCLRHLLQQRGAKLNMGRIIESGSHAALLASGGRYATLYEKHFAEITA